MNRAEDIEECAARWLACEDRGAGPGELAALDSWLAQSTAHRVAYLRLKDAWQRANSLAALQLPPQQKRQWSGFTGWPLRVLAAASVMICAGGAGLYFYLQSTNGIYATAIGQQKTIQLADGSTVELNTDTRIQTKVLGNVRAVTLDKGQAYFEVVHDPDHPFVVLAGNRRITDLGTKFSVLRNGDQIEVVVKEGKVRVDVLGEPQGRPPVFADGGKVVVARADETLVATRAPAEISNALDWRFGMLVFNQETLAEVAAQFNRYNDRKIVVQGAARDIRIGGSFRAGNIDVFAQLVQEGFGLSVDSSDDQIVISK